VRFRECSRDLNVGRCVGRRREPADRQIWGVEKCVADSLDGAGVQTVTPRFFFASNRLRRYIPSHRAPWYMNHGGQVYTPKPSNLIRTGVRKLLSLRTLSRRSLTEKVHLPFHRPDDVEGGAVVKVTRACAAIHGSSPVQRFTPTPNARPVASRSRLHPLNLTFFSNVHQHVIQLESAKWELQRQPSMLVFRKESYHINTLADPTKVPPLGLRNSQERRLHSPSPAS
jgi:hypothetical protein